MHNPLIPTIDISPKTPIKLCYYHNLNGVRGVAALMVVVFHFFIYPNANYLINLKIYQKITEFGQHGVSLFFILSGFVITRILINTRTDQDYFISFYRKRVLRILPLYYLFLFVYYNAIRLLDKSQNVDIILQLPYYLYLQNLTEILKIHASGPGHYWSLAVEEHFYLLWPFVILFILPKNIGKVIVVVIILVLFIKYVMLSNGLSINYFTFTRIDQILMGAYLAYLEFKNFFYKKNSFNKIMYIGFVAFFLSVFVYSLSDYFFFIKEMIKYLLLGLISFSIIGCLIMLKKENIVNRILLGNFWQYLGRISYGIYIWHVLVLIILNRYFVAKILFIDLFMTLTLTVGIAHLSYFYYEINFISKKKSYN